MPLRRVAVVGAGVTGLDLAHRLVRRGLEVTVFERDREVGGLAGSFDLRGRRVEKFYHFICRPDTPYLERLAELGLGDRVRWRRTRMGYFLEGRYHDWSTPLSLLRLDRLSLAAKLRYAANVLRSLWRRDWRDLEDVPAVDWLRRELGDEVYRLLWARLLEQKFHRFTGQVSAAWMWTRIRRVAASRPGLLHEELGYVEGGSEVIVQALAAAIAAAGGTIRTATPVRDVAVAGGRARGVVTAEGEQPFDAVLSTAPLTVVQAWPSLPEALRAAYGRIEHLGVLCSLLVLDRPMGEVFWLSISDPAVPLAVAVEYTNLVPMVGTHLVYVPEYLPRDDPRLRRRSAGIVADHVAALSRVSPGFSAARVVDAHVHRAEHGQPVYATGFTRRLPPIASSLPGFLAADTSWFFPEDRSIAESIRLAGRMERALVGAG